MRRRFGSGLKPIYPDPIDLFLPALLRHMPRSDLLELPLAPPVVERFLSTTSFCRSGEKSGDSALKLRHVLRSVWRFLNAIGLSTTVARRSGEESWDSRLNVGSNQPLNFSMGHLDVD